jgi:C4-dicarboxylate transporter, DctM subunit
LPNLPWGAELIIIFGFVFFFLFLGLPVGVALGLVGVVSSLFFLHGTGIMAYAAWNLTNNFILSSIPLFIFMGYLFQTSGLGERLYDGATAIVATLRGGLFHANIVACAIFAAISGSSVGTAATIGTMAVPQLLKRKYDPAMTLGSVAAGGTLGILIPPSTAMIIFGVICQVSIGDLFIAGVIPGIALALCFMAYIWIAVKFKPALAPKMEPIQLKKRVVGSMQVWPVIILLIIVLGGIYFGITTPTESASIGSFLCLVFALINRKLSWKVLDASVIGTMKAACMILFIMIGANLVGGTLGLLRIPAELAAWVGGLSLPPLAILIFIYVMYVILGCLIDATSMIVLTLPVVFPVIVALGYDPIWFGIVIVILVEMAMITPPVGLNVFTIHGMFPQYPLSTVFRGTIPFFLTMVIFLALLTAFPQIATFLPSTAAAAR